jgi:hypothetical protein
MLVGASEKVSTVGEPDLAAELNSNFLEGL